MKGRKFFASVWRANAVLIFVAGILGAAILAFALMILIKDATRDRTANVVAIADEEIDSTTTWLSDFERIVGTPLLRAKLHIRQSFSYGSGSKESGSVQNEFYFDMGSKKSYWLLPQFKGIILASHQLPSDEYEDNPKPAKARFYQLIEQDTNGDGKLTVEDRTVIAIAGPGGRPLFRIDASVDNVDGFQLNDAGTDVLIFYTLNSEFRFMNVDVATGKVTINSKLVVGE